MKIGKDICYGDARIVRPFFYSMGGRIFNSRVATHSNTRIPGADSLGLTPADIGRSSAHFAAFGATGHNAHTTTASHALKAPKGRHKAA